jgi:hypothetical protein
MKWCSGCQIEKPLDCFAPHKRKGLQPWCRDCNKVRSRRYYAENREKHRKDVRKHSIKQKHENYQRYCEYLLEHPCVDCGETDIIVLEPDHLRDKKQNVSRLVNAYSWSAVIAELDKCEIVCCNCHARRTQTRVRSYRIRFVESLGS